MQSDVWRREEGSMLLMLECVGRVADICDDKVSKEREENAKAAVVGL